MQNQVETLANWYDIAGINLVKSLKTHALCEYKEFCSKDLTWCSFPSPTRIYWGSPATARIEFVGRGVGRVQKPLPNIPEPVVLRRLWMRVMS
jgi:hypothetical protein